MRVPEVLASVARRMREDFSGISAEIEHRGGKGRLRESVVGEYLQRWMPRTVKVIQTGEAIAVAGDVSPELDVLLVDPGTPPLIDEQSYHVVPVECLHGVVQVKSRLDRAALREDADVIAAVKGMEKKAFYPQSGGLIEHTTNQYGVQWGHFPTWGAVFGYESASLELLLEELLDIDGQTPCAQRVDVVVSLERGVVVSLDDDGLVAMSATCNGRRAAIAAENPLLLLTTFMQRVMQQTWMPPFRLTDYLTGSLGELVSEGSIVSGSIDGGTP